MAVDGARGRAAGRAVAAGGVGVDGSAAVPQSERQSGQVSGLLTEAECSASMARQRRWTFLPQPLRHQSSVSPSSSSGVSSS